MQQSYVDEAESPHGFDIKRFLLKLVRNAPWIIVTLVIFLVAARFYLMYQTPMYQVSTFILLHPEQYQKGGGNNTSISDETVASSENIKDIVSNEVFIFRSRSLVRQVVDSLALNISLSTYKKLKKEALNLDESPFSIAVKRRNPDAESPAYQMNLSKNSFTLQQNDITYKGEYNTPLPVNGDTITIALKQAASFSDGLQYGLRLRSINKTVAKYASRISVSSVPKAGNGMVQVSVKDELAGRARKIIDVLIHQFNLANLKYKNQSTRLAIDFFNKRLDALDGELQAQENQVSAFKAQNKIYDVSVAANQLLTTLGNIDIQKSQNDLQDNLLSLVEKNIKSYNNYEEIVPNSSGLQDAVLSELINRYNKMVLDRRMILDQGTQNDPRLQATNGQLEEIRTSILKNVSNIRNEIRTNKNALSTQERSYNYRFESLPQKEKEYIQLNRTLGIKESLYVYLLQKREETSIQLVSSDMAQSRIIDEGVDNGLVFPRSRFIYMMAFGAGILLPSFIILLLSFINKKVESREDVESNVTLSIAGEIGLAPKKNKLMIVSSGNHSPIAEQFRSLRTNVFYLEKELGGKTFLITSFMRGEGKSFIALNLADAIAVSNKKVILLDFDLRKARLSENLNCTNSPGISNFLTSSIFPEEIIQPINNAENISFISAGYYVTNPGELILNERMQALFGYLKQNFDYIIIDSPPVGLVPDAITIGSWADITLFIMRHNYSLLSSTKLIKELNEGHKLPNPTIVINGIQKGRGYAFGGYGYGYGYDAYTRAENKRLIIR